MQPSDYTQMLPPQPQPHRQCSIAPRLGMHNNCSKRLRLERDFSKDGTRKHAVSLHPSFAAYHPTLVPQAVFANAQDLFMFNSYVSSQARFQDPLYQAYCADKYQKFLALQRDHPSVALVPTPCIDLVLQAHLIRPKTLRCALEPWRMRLPERTTGFAVAQRETLAETAHLWTAKYGSSYDDSLAVPEDFVKPNSAIIEFDIIPDITMYQSLGVEETDFFAITNGQYAQLIASHLQNHNDVVAIVVLYAQDRRPAEALCAAYQKFMQWVFFLSRRPHVSPSFVPVGLVDYIWHAHMLQHSAYCVFSDDLIGHLLVHEPGIPSAENSELEKKDTEAFCAIHWPLDSPLSEQSHLPDLHDPNAPRDCCMYCGATNLVRATPLAKEPETKAQREPRNWGQKFIGLFSK